MWCAPVIDRLLGSCFGRAIVVDVHCGCRVDEVHRGGQGDEEIGSGGVGCVCGEGEVLVRAGAILSAL